MNNEKMEKLIENAHSKFLEYARSNGTKDDSEYRTLYNLDFIRDAFKKNDPYWIEENNLSHIWMCKSAFELKLLIGIRKELPHEQIYNKAKRKLINMIEGNGELE